MKCVSPKGFIPSSIPCFGYVRNSAVAGVNMSVLRDSGTSRKDLPAKFRTIFHDILLKSLRDPFSRQVLSSLFSSRLSSGSFRRMDSTTFRTASSSSPSLLRSVIRSLNGSPLYVKSQAGIFVSHLPLWKQSCLCT
jgi:hypothetical protein